MAKYDVIKSNRGNGYAIIGNSGEEYSTVYPTLTDAYAKADEYRINSAKVRLNKVQERILKEIKELHDSNVADELLPFIESFNFNVRELISGGVFNG